MIKAITVHLTTDVPPEVLDAIREAAITVDGADLLPLLGGVVHDVGEFLHEWGGTDGDLTGPHHEDAPPPERARHHAQRVEAAIDALIGLNRVLVVEKAQEDAERQARMAGFAGGGC